MSDCTDEDRVRRKAAVQHAIRYREKVRELRARVLVLEKREKALAVEAKRIEALRKAQTFYYGDRVKVRAGFWYGRRGMVVERAPMGAFVVRLRIGLFTVDRLEFKPEELVRAKPLRAK